jgi:hypothetical protein
MQEGATTAVKSESMILLRFDPRRAGDAGRSGVNRDGAIRRLSSPALLSPILRKELN